MSSRLSAAGQWATHPLPWVAVLALAALSAGARAQTAPAPPTASPIERLAPTTPPSLAPSIAPPPLVPQTGPGAAQRITIGRVVLPDSETIPAARLRPAVEGLEGATIPLSRIEEARLDLLRIWREAGYPFAAVNASVAPAPGAPAPGGAELRFTVVEGYVSEVKLEGDIGPAGTQVLRFLNPLTEVRPLTGAAIERALLLASDIPGVTVRGLLRPVAGEPGALQLVAQVSRRSVSGYVTTDNRAYELTGPWQVLGAISANSFTSLGERTELALYQSESDTQRFGQVSEEFFIGGSGLRMRLYAGAGRARPDGSLAQNGYAGATRVLGAALIYPIIRSRPVNLNVSAGLDALESEVKQGFTPFQARQSYDSVRALRLALDGSLLESVIPFLPQASSFGLIRVSRGLEAFGATGANSVTAGRPGSDFGFQKVNFDVTRNQPLFLLDDAASLSLQASVAGQWSDDVLPSSEKFYFGGNRLGRGFYSGQVTGDRAIGASFEAQIDRRFEIPDTPFGPLTIASQLYAFRDFGRAFENNTDPNRRVSSFGLGLRLTLNESYQFELEGVKRVSRRVDAGSEALPPLEEQAVYTRFLARF
ncbi:ShlB/FhaC/HecB family hemolysin secretion/activation protein [Humitalea rosea]|nr:ShlB/FhaC/HecB family hemolysin secretion/activation protein [Humitalea rosea]